MNPPIHPDRPDSNSYWVKPGQLLAGEYPGAKNEAAARQKLARFLDAGLTFFIDLTEPHELEPYEAMLKKEAAARGLAVEYRRFPIRDAGLPKTARQMVDILNTIDQAIAAGHAVYVHCWGGIGRTGTVIGCHLVRHGRSGDEALQEIARLWHFMEKRHRRPHSPETAEQVEFVRRWLESKEF